MSEKTFKRNSIYNFLPEEVVSLADPEHPDHKREGQIPRYQALDEGLIRSIDAFGVIQNITLCKNGDTVIVETGNRRVLHAREVNRLRRERAEAGGAPYLPVRVGALFSSFDEVKISSHRIIENNQREADDPMTTARQLQWILDQGGDIEDCVLALGKGEQTVRLLLKLNDLPRAIQNAVQQGKLAYTRAIQLHGMERKEQMERFKEWQGSDSEEPSTEGETSGGSSEKPKRKRQVRGTKAPSKKHLRKIAEQAKEKDTPIYRTFTLALQYAVGDLSKEEVIETLQGISGDDPDEQDLFNE